MSQHPMTSNTLGLRKSTCKATLVSSLFRIVPPAEHPGMRLNCGGQDYISI